MKNSKKYVSVLLALLMGASMALPLMACGGTGDNGGSKDNTNANVISASILDGKVANLLSANGIAIQDKTQNGATMYKIIRKGKRNNENNHDE